MIKYLFKKIIKNNLLSFIGLSRMNFDLILYLKHYKWIFKINSLPFFKIRFYKSNKNQNINFVKKIISYYNLNKLENNQASQLWNDGLKKYSSALHNALANPNDATEILNKIFISESIYGLSSGSAYKYCKGYLGRKIWNAKYIDLIISLAEYLKLTRFESVQQGNFGDYSNSDIIKIIKNVEKKINLPLSFPNIGSPYGITVLNNKLLTFEDIEHLYAALRISEYIDTLDIDSDIKINIVEIGGGYGGLCKWLKELLKDKINNYSIIDLPLINTIQFYFLGNYFQKGKIDFGYDINKPCCINILTPNCYFENYVTSEFTIVINQNSMPEMNKQIVNNYLNSFVEKKFKYFLSFNHEAISKYKNYLQISVGEELNLNTRYELKFRNPSFIRTGYLEEVYKIN